MNFKDKNDYKLDFKKNLDKLSEKLQNYVASENGDWTIKGFIDIYKNVYTISFDTKIISKILEIHIFPQILQFAKEIGYKIILAEYQNYYPDLTFINKENEDIKFAVDLKTTYRKKNGLASFTLGSHGTYFKDRDKKKNIQFPYNAYLGHYCLGIIYSRTDLYDNISETEIYKVKELENKFEIINNNVEKRKVTIVENIKNITSVIKDFEFFSAEKWKIASDKQGSGNTANIGVTLGLNDLKNENGVFSRLGEKWFDEYWMNYGIATMIKKGKTIKITNIKDFLEFKGRNDLLNKVVENKY
ncbi:MAG: EcoRV family type II restriction endonuclease [Bacteroidales bacterium]|jgi:hypothetical protein|nr:EcoRV family type II restriction endonuclease [Bacteroidales bacterium]